MVDQKLTIEPATPETDEKGASLVEYVLLVSLIAIIAIAAIRFFGKSISTQFSRVASQV